MLKNITNRLTDPFLSIFITSTLMWNWKIIFILLFDDQSMINRISFIDFYFIRKQNSFVEIFLLPFLLSLIWFFCFPKIKEKILEFDETQKLRQNKLIIDLNNSLERKPEVEQFEENSYAYFALLPEFFKTIHREIDNSANQYQILKNDSIQLGQWIRIEARRVYLAKAGQENTSYANGICVKILNNSYFVAQTSGNIPASFFTGQSDIHPAAGSNLNLSTQSGAATSNNRNKIKNQKLGEWVTKDSTFYLHLKFEKY